MCNTPFSFIIHRSAKKGTTFAVPKPNTQKVLFGTRGFLGNLDLLDSELEILHAGFDVSDLVLDLFLRALAAHLHAHHIGEAIELGNIDIHLTENSGADVVPDPVRLLADQGLQVVASEDDLPHEITGGFSRLHPICFDEILLSVLGDLRVLDTILLQDFDDHPVLREMLLNHLSLADEVEDLVHADHCVEQAFHSALGVLGGPPAAEVVDRVHCFADIEVLHLVTEDCGRDSRVEVVLLVDEGDFPANLGSELDLGETASDDPALHLLCERTLVIVTIEKTDHEVCVFISHRLALSLVAVWPGIEPGTNGFKVRCSNQLSYADRN
jgi:hypothetical protein